jgi:hypothetical protein
MKVDGFKIETDLSKLIDDVIQECIHDMTRSYTLKYLKRSPHWWDDVDMKAFSLLLLINRMANGVNMSIKGFQLVCF